MISESLRSWLEDLAVVKDNYHNFLFTMRSATHVDNVKMAEWYTSLISKLENYVRSRSYREKHNLA